MSGMTVSAAPPGWWVQAGLDGHKVINSTAAASNPLVAVNIGQAKFMAKRALETIHGVNPALATRIEADLVGPGKIIPSWNVPTPGSALAKAQHAPLLMGQLKAIAAPFYKHVADVNPATANWLSNELTLNQTRSANGLYPWTATNDESNLLPANLGQLKACFALHFTDPAQGDSTQSFVQAINAPPDDPSNQVPANGFDIYGMPIPPGIPPLTIDAEAPHQAVGALKGSLSVGGDGSANYTIPIDIPKGTAGMEPKLSLGYSSGSGNGIVGVGWNLAGFQTITRGSSSAAKDGSYDRMDFDASDRYFLDGERLVCVEGNYGAAGSEYRTEMDSFARITAIGGSVSAGPASWKVETKAGLIMFLGGTEDSKLSIEKGTLSWGVNQVQDTLGNYYSVEYERDAADEFDFVNHRVSKVSYTGKVGGKSPDCSIEFDYASRPDTSRNHTTTHASYRVTKRLAKIRVLTGNFVNHSYRLAYDASYQSGRSFLKSVTKHMRDDDRDDFTVPATNFTYDGLQPAEEDENPLWENAGINDLPVYGTDLDATSEVNSMVTANSDGNLVRLTGDVARAYRLPDPGVTLYEDSMIQFEFRSSNLHTGAIIGLDNNTSYNSSSDALYRVSKMVDGQSPPSINMSNGDNFSGPCKDYNAQGDWQTFTLPIGSLGSSGPKDYLVLMCVDNDSSDGVDNATFRNVKIYRSGSQEASEVTPIEFSFGTQLPRYATSDGEDLGVMAVDLDSDGLVDLTDWRVQDYHSDGGNGEQDLKLDTLGNVFRNTGGNFVSADTIRPPPFLPLSCRATEGNASSYNAKHHLLAQPVDVDGDGNLDLMGSVNLRVGDGENHSLKNEYAFYSLVNGVWTERPEWQLPFRIVNGESDSEGSGGRRRDEHFQWMDLDADGYQDLVVHTSNNGQLYNRITNNLIIGSHTGIAFLNKGRHGPGWTIDKTSRYLPEPLMESGKDVGRRIVDIDGDGILEMIEAVNGEASKTYRMNAPSTDEYRWKLNPNDRYNLPDGEHAVPLVDGPGESMGVMLLDLNGDGMVDISESNSDSSPRFWRNRGARGDTSWVRDSSSPPVSALPDSYLVPFPLHFQKDGVKIPYGFETADLNGDGLLDILYSDANDTERPGSENLVLLNTGKGWRAEESWGLPGDFRIFKTSDERRAQKRRAKLQDLNGDGFPDLITGLLDQTPRVRINKCRPEVLKSVIDGFGAELKVEYKRLNDPAPTTAPKGFLSRVYQKFTGELPAGQSAIIDSRLVVSRYGEPNAKGSWNWTSRRYGDLRYDRYNESSLGFGWTEVLDERNGQTSRTETSRVYPFGGSPIMTRTSVLVESNDLDSAEEGSALPGVTTGTKILSEETATYAQLPSTNGIGGTVRRPVQTNSVKSLYDLTGDLVSRTTTTQALADFDAYGFVEKSTVTSLDGTAVTTTSNYNHVTTGGRWHLGRLGASTVTKAGGGKATIIKKSSFGYYSDTGLLELETIEPGSALSSTKTYTYDSFGNIAKTSVTGSGITRSSSSFYGSQGRFLLKETNQLGHTVSYGYDPDRALLTATTDIAGKTTRFAYDNFSTLIRTYHPDGTQTGESTGFAGNSSLPASVVSAANPDDDYPIRYFRAKQSSGSPVAKVYLDAGGRELVTETTILRNAATGATSKVYTVSKYDFLGRKWAVSDPFGAGDTDINFTYITYDLLSRVIRTSHPNGSYEQVLASSTVTLNGQPVSYSKSHNANGGILERWEDQHGRLVQSRDTSNQITTFQHDHEGRILNVAINNATLLTNVFDLLGNKIRVTEANSGTSSSTYNALGEVTSSTNAKGQATRFTFDALGRPKSVIKPEGTYTCHYVARGSARGKLWKTTGPDGYVEIITYDNFARPLTTTKTQRTPTKGLETFTTSITYDTLGRVRTETDAGGLTIAHKYTEKYSFPLKMSMGTTPLWQAGTYDSKGRVLTQTLANGVTTTTDYHPDSGLLTSLKAFDGGSRLQEKTYVWDSLGNLQNRTDAISGRTESFLYDNLNRVTRASVSGSGGPSVANYGYSPNGNLTSKPGASIEYEDARPHAVSSATIKGAARTYAYDAAGYVTGDGKRTYTWTSFGQLASLDYLSAPALQNLGGTQIYAASRVQTNFTFDAGGNRAGQLKQRIALDDSRMLEETLYLGSYEREIHSTKATASATPVVTRAVHRHNLGGFAVYTRTEKPGEDAVDKLTTVLKDHLGSTDVLYTSTWNDSTDSFINPHAENQSFDPWGERRAPETLVSYRATDADPFRASGQDYDRGYTGHEQLDDSGLIHMNGRLYDPELGRMLSPDPFVQVPEYSQNFNRY